MTELIERIKKEYPNGIITNSISQNKELYYQILRAATINHCASAKSYLRSLGFVFASEDREELKKEIVEELSNRFSDKVVIASELYHTPLFYKVKKYQLDGMSLSELFEELGYQYKCEGWHSRYDYDSLKRFCDEYFTKQRDVTRALGINRGTLNNIVNGKVNAKASGASWKIDCLDEFEEELLMKCIVDRLYSVEKGSIHMTVHNNGKGKVAIVIRNAEEDSIRIMFDEDIPEYFKHHMERQGLTYLYENENEFIYSANRITVLGKKYILAENENNKIWNSIKNAGSRKRGISTDEFCELVGIKGVHPYENSDEDVLDILSRNADENGTVAQTNLEILHLNRHFRHYRFEMQSEDFQQFENWEEYINYYGFYSRGVHPLSSEIFERRKRIIDMRNAEILADYVVDKEENLAIISSMSEIYRYLVNACRPRGFSSLQEYAESLGFKVQLAGRNTRVAS